MRDRDPEPDAIPVASSIVRNLLNRPDVAEAWSIALLLFVAIIAVSQTGGRTFDVVIDIGRDLYIPGRILQGERLYKDLAYNYPPLAPYLMASFVGLFGDSLRAWYVFGLCISFLLTASMYVAARLIAGRLAAFLVGLLVVSVNLAGGLGSNFIFPYSHAAVIGSLFLAIYLSMAVVFVRRSDSRFFAGMLVVGSLAAWTKLEVALIVLLTTVALLVVERAWRLLATAVVAGALQIVLVARAFGPFPGSLSLLVGNIMAPTLIGSDAARHFARFVSGVSQLPRNLLLALLSGTLIAVVTLLLRWISRAGKEVPDSSRFLWYALVAVVLLSYFFTLQDLLFRGWAVIQWLLLGMAILRRDRLLLLLSVASIGGTFRIFLRVVPEWYGFYLILPTYLLIVYLLFRTLPSWKVYSHRASLLWVPSFVMVAVTSLLSQHVFYSRMRFPIETPRGIVYDRWGDRARVLNEFFREVHRFPPKSMAVFPEGVSLNYFAEIPTTLSRYIFTPVETGDRNVEATVVDELRLRPPESVVILTRNVEEYGSKGFGVDYDRLIVDYVSVHYHVAKQWVKPQFTLIYFLRNR